MVGAVVLLGGGVWSVLAFGGEDVNLGTSVGPDVTVYEVREFSNPTTSGSYKGYSIGTNSCNVGDKPLWWCNDAGDPYCSTDQHPVIAQNMYRLKTVPSQSYQRFEQIGMSWLKHGFLSTNSFAAGCGNCVQPPHGGDQLGVGCTDIYGSGLNGSRPLGMRSEVDPTSGAFPYPYTNVGAVGVDQLVKVLTADLDPAQNVGARYFGEAQYIAADDAASGNDLNNASYKEVSVNASYVVSQVTPTVREQPAIRAWQAIDAQVVLTNVDMTAPGSSRIERFHVARRVTDLGGGQWHYEYAVHNMNSALSARAVTVSFPVATTVANIGFKDVDHHSGEPYDTTNWTFASTGVGARWETTAWTTNANANALRWGTMFNFWFDANQPPTSAALTIEPFTGVLFADSFEAGDTSAWSETGP
jgi:hypothetical protein